MSVRDEEKGRNGVRAFNTRVTSSEFACTMRSRAIRASARYLSDLVSVRSPSYTIHEWENATHDESVKVCLGPFTCEISLRSSLRIR